MEFAGYDSTISPDKIAMLRSGASRYLHEPTAEPVVQEWYGWRPMTPDSVPIIDRALGLDNVWLAAGHNMLGLSMAPATGKLVADLLAKRPPHVDATPYAVRRFL